MKKIFIFIFIFIFSSFFAYGEDISDFKFKKNRLYLVHVGASSYSSLLGHFGIIVNNLYYSFVPYGVDGYIKRLEAYGSDSSIFVEKYASKLLNEKIDKQLLFMEKKRLTYLGKALLYANRDITVAEINLSKDKILNIRKALNNEFLKERREMDIRFYDKFDTNCIVEIERIIKIALGLPTDKLKFPSARITFDCEDDKRYNGNEEFDCDQFARDELFKEKIKRFDLHHLSTKQSFNRALKHFSSKAEKVLIFPSLQRYRRLSIKQDHPIKWCFEFFKGISQSDDDMVDPHWRIMYTEELNGAGKILRPIGGVLNFISSTAQTIWGVLTLKNENIKRGGIGMLTSLSDIFFFPANYGHFTRKEMNFLLENEIDQRYIQEVISTFQ